MRLAVVVVLLAVAISFVFAIGITTPTITVFLPDAGHGSQPLCISNRTHTDLSIPHGPTIRPAQMVTASVERDYQWGFSPAEPATDRQDVDCLVVQ